MKYKIIHDKNNMNIDVILLMLNKTYWANERTKETMIKAIDNSECISIEVDNKLVAFARIVTDYSTFFWICDVVVHEDYRNMDLGKMLIEEIKKLDFYNSSLGVLATRDAFGLYEKFGFEKDPIKFMRKPRNKK